jgi:Tfp pilus assembly protein PilV
MMALSILAIGVLGVAAAQVTALHKSTTSRESFGAAQVAKAQIAQIRRLPWSAIVQTGSSGADFENLCPTNAAGGTCIGSGTSGYPGASPASLPLVFSGEQRVDGSTAINTTYTVSWRVQDVAISGVGTAQCRKDVHIRVEWTDGNYPTREFYLSTRIFNSLGDRNATSTDLGIPSSSLSGGC